MNFRAGDVVQLKSGGPKMTVSSEEQYGMTYCVWFEGSKQQGANFNVETLKKVGE
jgi:uncharacterized protein YodC (DUF2158 family)